MIDLKTTYMGIDLANPIVVAACGLTGTAEGVGKAARSGAGAIVLKSLFEEQILAEIRRDFAGIDIDAHPEGEAFISRTGWEEGAGAYLRLIEDARKAAEGVPVFASINCLGSGNWADFAKNIAQAGASGLELNVAFLPFDAAVSGAEIEKKVLATVKEVRKVSSLPLAIKLGASYSSLPNLARSLAKEGANALILFNRFFRFDFDLETLKMKTGQPLSGNDDYHESLRWVSLLYQRAGIELAAATGIHDAETVVKMIFAGAGTVQICSALYTKKGYQAVTELVDGLRAWMAAHKYPSVDAIRGDLSARNAAKPQEYLRLQYIKALTGIH